VVVGQNDFVAEAEPVPIMKIDPRIEADQVERLRAFRATRNEVAWAESLRRVDAAARANDNLVPVILESVKTGATVGEISDTLRKVWGEYTEVLTV
ncbi:MAG TPA: methylmalonyl-CoA mutase family protein, partial [Polyangiaceae bacterium]|nr:methylmalonyl-CoA mutase family protein [Polyangiaceae bacterium]